MQQKIEVKNKCTWNDKNIVNYFVNSLFDLSSVVL